MYNTFSSADSKGNSNVGSCTKLANYLDKEQENEWLNHEQNDIKTAEVVAEIDRYGKGQIKANKWKFVEVMYSPTKEEQQHIIKRSVGKENVQEWSELTPEDKIKVKAEFEKFIINAQTEQAKNYNRPGIEDASDLKWYAKIETQRKYKGTDEAVKQGLAKQNDLKKGLNLHAHIIQSRKAMNKKTQLSPLSIFKSESKKSNIKQGFNRQEFTKNVEKCFDKTYIYERDLKQKYEYKLAVSKNDLKAMESLESHALRHVKEQLKDVDLNQGLKLNQEQNHSNQQGKILEDLGLNSDEDGGGFVAPKRKKKEIRKGKNRSQDNGLSM